MRSFFIPSITSLLLAFTINNNVATAQSPECYSCIHGSIPFVADCTSLTQTQLATLDSVIHGVRVYTNIGDYRTKDPGAFGCLKSLMWDVVHYNANLWSTCLDPETRCSWHEMMHYLEMIPKIAASYGVSNPPAQVLVNPPQ